MEKRKRSMRKVRGLAMAIILGILGACATTGTTRVPGKTLASTQLQKETVETIVVRESMAGGPCRTPKVLDTEVMEMSSGPKYDGDRLTAGKWKERWTVNLCDNVVRYRVEFTTNQLGGTVINLGAPETSK